jgi:hypothetical protein
MGMLKALKTHPNVIPWKFKNHLCVGLVCHVQYKMKIDFIDIPISYNIAKKATNYFMYFDFKLDIYVIVFTIGLRFVLSYFSSLFFHFFTSTSRITMGHRKKRKK